MLSYEVMDEETAMNERFQLLKEGEYDAVVMSSEDKVSSSGNHMMEIILAVYDAEGKAHSVRDFLVFTKPMMWKVIHCADSAKVKKAYLDGKFCSRVLVDNGVRVKVGVEAGKEIPSDKLNGKPQGSKYPDKNKIEDYIKECDQAPLSHSSPEDEDIPF